MEVAGSKQVFTENLTKVRPGPFLKMTKAEELEKEQLELARKVVKHDAYSKLELIGGLDVRILEDKVICSIAVCNYRDMQVLEHVLAEKECKIRYLPGFRAQNELGIMIEAFNKDKPLNPKVNSWLINSFLAYCLTKFAIKPAITAQLKQIDRAVQLSGLTSLGLTSVAT